MHRSQYVAATIIQKKGSWIKWWPHFSWGQVPMKILPPQLSFMWRGLLGGADGVEEVKQRKKITYATTPLWYLCFWCLWSESKVLLERFSYTSWHRNNIMLLIVLGMCDRIIPGEGQTVIYTYSPLSARWLLRVDSCVLITLVVILSTREDYTITAYIFLFTVM